MHKTRTNFRRASKRCAICTRGYRNYLNIRLFQLPSDPNMRRRWLTVCNLPEQYMTTMASICNLHFKKHELTLFRLPLNAIPSVNLTKRLTDLYCQKMLLLERRQAQRDREKAAEPPDNIPKLHWKVPRQTHNQNDDTADNLVISQKVAVPTAAAAAIPDLHNEKVQTAEQTTTKPPDNIPKLHWKVPRPKHIENDDTNDNLAISHKNQIQTVIGVSPIVHSNANPLSSQNTESPTISTHSNVCSKTVVHVPVITKTCSLNRSGGQGSFGRISVIATDRLLQSSELDENTVSPKLIGKSVAINDANSRTDAVSNVMDAVDSSSEYVEVMENIAKRNQPPALKYLGVTDNTQRRTLSGCAKCRRYKERQLKYRRLMETKCNQIVELKKTLAKLKADNHIRPKTPPPLPPLQQYSHLEELPDPPDLPACYGPCSRCDVVEKRINWLKQQNKDRDQELTTMKTNYRQLLNKYITANARLGRIKKRIEEMSVLSPKQIKNMHELIIDIPHMGLNDKITASMLFKYEKKYRPREKYIAGKLYCYNSEFYSFLTNKLKLQLPNTRTLRRWLKASQHLEPDLEMPDSPPQWPPTSALPQSPPQSPQLPQSQPQSPMS